MKKIIKYTLPIIVGGIYLANAFYQESNVKNFQTELIQAKQELKQAEIEYEKGRNNDCRRSFTISPSMWENMIKFKRSNEKVEHLENKVKTAERRAVTIF